MEMVEVKCANCSKEIYVQQQYTREKMFCTIGCLSSHSKFYPNGRTFP